MIGDNGTGYLNWISYTWNYPEYKLLHSYGGMDQVMYLKYMKYSAILFAVFTLLGLSTLLPVNITGGVR